MQNDIDRSILATGLASASNSASDRHNVHAVVLKLPEFWADNARVWFAQKEAQFSVRNLTCSLTKFNYFVADLGRADTAQVVDLIEYSPDELLYESLREYLNKLHTLNPFQEYQTFMSLTLAANEKPSTLMGKMSSTLPLSHRVHKDECFLFKGFFLPPNIRIHVSATSPAPPGCDDSVNSLCQHAQPRPAFCFAPCPAPRPSHPPSSSTTCELCSGIIANTVIKLNIAELHAHGIRETN